ncbi:DUF695 domain-containing protein [Carnobacterium gallinarum]|uniref:DUF695 domain-containing protein n=1 Tax=Carnobacterium gallinarum TaxID=2749 RepID=UPI000A025A6D|nr:DUF695 domain-containing protein [Carnobacterium gallinarum]
MLSDNWEVYISKIDDIPTVIRINMDAKKTGFPERFPECMILTLTVLEQVENGFPSPQELTRLQEVEQAVSDVIGEEGILPVSLTSQDGTRDLIMFTNQPSFLSTRISNRLEKLEMTAEMYQLGSPSNSDDAWAWYDFVYPTERILTYIKGRNLVAHREKSGDVLEIPRPIDYFAYFETKEDAASFALVVEADGFTIISEDKVGEPEGKDNYLVSIQRVDMPTYDVMSDIDYMLYDVVSFYQGRYDGWGANVIQDDSAQ